jgi:hypothetical protein
MMCTGAKCSDMGPVSNEELQEIVAEFAKAPRCSIKGKAAQAATAVLCYRDLLNCPMCQAPYPDVTPRCRNCYKGPFG